ncbi:MAG: amidohydrolase [Anaerolineae bacterium]|nr:amidohydrolase [Anaerolineae bacterium]
MNTLRKYRVAAIQFESQQGQQEANLVRIESLVRKAASSGAKLIVLPEMATVGLFWNSPAAIAPYVEPIPGPTSERFAALAKALNVYIAVGMGEVEPTTGTVYNSAILVGPEGLIGKHRKVHGYLSDPMFAADGNLGFQVWDTPLGKLGLMICMDANYPESARLLALAGADVLLMPVGWVVEVCPAPLWITRAFDNGVPAICANRWGEERGQPFSGGSCILNPDGSVQHCLGKTDRDEMVFGEIDLDDPRRSRMSFDPAVTPLMSRRPELYGSLALNRYLWNPLTMHATFGVNPLPEGAPFRIVTCELAVPPQPLEVQINQIEALIAQSTDNLPHLIVLPEFSFTGPPQNQRAAEAVAEPIPGPMVASLEAWCAKSGSYIVAGLVEKDDERLYNTLVLVGPQGLVTRYRKTHLGSIDTAWATPGNALVWADTPIGRIGLLSGTDLLYPEPARCLAIEGVDVVCIPSALTGPVPIRRAQVVAPPQDHPNLHWHLARTRAGENDVYIAFANWHGSPYMGNSGIFFGPVLLVAPAEEALATPTGVEGLNAAVIDIDTRTEISAAPHNPLRAKPSIARRLPTLCTPLLQRVNIPVEAPSI